MTLHGSEDPFHPGKQRPLRPRHSPSDPAEPRPGNRTSVNRSPVFLDPILVLRSRQRALSFHNLCAFV